MTKIKLCGLTRICDIEIVNKLMPEYIGFIFAEKSRRFVSKDNAIKLKSILNPKIKAVGVFVNKSITDILTYSDIIDVIQLHGQESNDYINELKSVSDKSIIKAFCLDENNAINSVNNSFADFVLLDSKNGGTGKTFDWNLIKEIKKPYFLAGGLTKDNVSKALKELSPYAVDVSSGIETNGFKDKNKMTDFVNAVREEK